LHEKITKGENAIVAGIRQRPVAVAGLWRAYLAGSSQNCRIPAGSRPFWPYPAGSIQIQPDPGHFGQIRPAYDHGRILVSFSWNLVRRQYFGSRMLSDSGAAWIPMTNHCQISAIRYQTCVQGRRVLTLEIDLRFLKP